MNNKKIIITVSIIFGLLLISLLIYVVSKNNKQDNIGSVVTEVKNLDEGAAILIAVPKDPMTLEEKNRLSLNHLDVYDVTSRDKDGDPVEYKRVGAETPKTISIVDWMTDVEKAKLGIAPETRIQVLERASDSSVIAWRLIKTDEDIITKY